METGENPVLSRNCNPHTAESQVDYEDRGLEQDRCLGGRRFAKKAVLWKKSLLFQVEPAAIASRG